MYFTGVWTVGNVGREKGGFRWALVAAYLSYPLRYYLYDESIWFTLMVVCSAMAFDQFSKQWRREPPKKQKLSRFVNISRKNQHQFDQI